MIYRQCSPFYINSKETWLREIVSNAPRACSEPGGNSLQHRIMGLAYCLLRMLSVIARVYRLYNDQDDIQAERLGSDSLCFIPTHSLKRIWWRHQMETFSALLALYAGNLPVTDEFPSQRPVTRNFDVFFDLRLNKQLSKQSWGWWFETPWRSLWHHVMKCRRFAAKTFNIIVSIVPADNQDIPKRSDGHVQVLYHDDVIKWKHFPRYWPFLWGIHRGPVNSPHKSQWRGALVFSLICVWINGWVNNSKAGGLRRHRARYDVM